MDETDKYSHHLYNEKKKKKKKKKKRKNKYLNILQQ